MNNLIKGQVSELLIPPTQGGSWFSVEEGAYYPEAIGIKLQFHDQILHTFLLTSNLLQFHKDPLKE